LASGFEPVGEELIAKKQRKRVERQLMLLKANLLRKKKRLEKGNEADESGAATPTRDHRMPRHFHSRIVRSCSKWIRTVVQEPTNFGFFFSFFFFFASFVESNGR
jgi:hypothetical protein